MPVCVCVRLCVCLRVCVCVCVVCVCVCAGRLSGAPELVRVRVFESGGGVVRLRHRGAVRPAQREPEGGAAESGLPLRAALPRGAQD